MDRNGVGFLLTLIGTVCWGVCFWWVHRISAKQNYLLDQLREQGRRIKEFSKIEHDLIKGSIRGWAKSKRAWRR